MENYKHSENKAEIYKNLIEHANDIIFILSCEGNIIDANKQAVHSYGYSYDELIQMNVFDLRDPGSLESAKRQFQKAKADGVEFETWHYRKDGTSFLVEVKSVGIQDGPYSYIASIIRDITMRRKGEEEIRILASIVESSEDAILGVTTEGIITSWNKGAENLYGYSKEEILGQHAHILLPKDSKDNLNEIINRVKNKERIEHYEATRRRKDGQIIYIAAAVSPIYNFEGCFAGVSVMMRDLTEKHMLTKKLNENEERWKLANELMFANAFQSSLMSDIKHFDLASVYGKYIPSSMVGGDLYDCMEVGSSLWFIIADVTGHGLVAAMVSTMIKGVFGHCIQGSVYPNEVLESMNHILCRILGDGGERMVSAFIGVIREGTLYYSNAGHPYPVFLQYKSKEAGVLEQNGFLLAMDDGVAFNTMQVDISAGDMVILYTDGLFDFNDTGHDSDWDRIREYTLSNSDLLKDNAQTYIDNLLHLFKRDGADFDDDVSIMIISKT